MRQSQTPDPASNPIPPQPLTRTLTICNAKGLHARASARFVETVESFDAMATVRRDGQTVTGDSIMGLLMLAASQGTTIDVSVDGPQADALMSALETLIADRFGEER
jgi:phosphocarrier protein HPr